MPYKQFKILPFILCGMCTFSTPALYAARNATIDHAGSFANSQQLVTITQLNKNYEFKLANTVPINSEQVKLKFNQYYLNVPVWGASVSATKEKAGEMNSLFGNYVADIEGDIRSVTPAMSTQQVLDIALKAAKISSKAMKSIDNELISLHIKLDDSNRARLVYLVSFMVNDNNPTRPHFIIDANAGKILEQWDGLTTKDAIGPGGNQKTGQYNYGTDYGYLVVSDVCNMDSPNVETWDLNSLTTGGAVHRFDCTGTPPINTYKAINGAFSPINDAHYFGNVVFNLYKTWFNTSPLTFKLRMRVHYGVNYQNAFWDGQQMTFGDGASSFYPFTALDVVGHEVSHGFTAQNSNLTYAKQPGGINEAFSDMAGEAVEYFNTIGKTKRNDWLVGATIMKTSTALRYFDDPTKDGRSIGNAKDYTDTLDVHYSSGVYNKAFYTLANKANWDVEKAFRAFVLANQIYWNQSTNYDQGGCGVMKAAKDLTYNTADVIDAFTAVGVNASCAVADMGTIQVSTTTDTDVKCNAAKDTLLLDQSTTGPAFTVLSGISQSTAIGAHTLKLASNQAAIPAGGGLNGTCKSTLDVSQVNVTKDTISPVKAKYVYTEPAPTPDTGVVQVLPDYYSDARCKTAVDTITFDQNTTGLKFTVQNGFAQVQNVGTHTVKLASQTSIPAGSGANGTCKSTLDKTQVVVTKGVTVSINAKYAFTDNTPVMSCKIVSAKVVAQGNWGTAGVVNTFDVQFSLQNFPKDERGQSIIDANFEMKNNIIRHIWGNFRIVSSSRNMNRGTFKGQVWPFQNPTISGFIDNSVALKVGDNPLNSLKINGIQCT